MRPPDPATRSGLDEITKSLKIREQGLRGMVDREHGPIWGEFDELQATSLLCIVNEILNVSAEVRKMAGLLGASVERPHSGDAETRQD